MEDKLREAIVEELRRQAAEGGLSVGAPDADGLLELRGRIDIEALVMVVAGAMAGGP